MAEKFTDIELLAMARDGLRDIGYRDELLRTDYPFADVLDIAEVERRIHLAAFAQEPPSYRNACFGVTIPRHDGPEAIQQLIALGAPRILALHPTDAEIRVWRMAAQGKPELIERIQPENLRAIIRARKDSWNPDYVLRAKSIGFSSAPAQLDFFDVGLVPILDEIVQKKLDKLLRDVIASSEALFNEIRGHKPDISDTQALFRLIFRLLAAKLLIDRQQGDILKSSDPQSVLNAIEAYYFRNTPTEPILPDKEIQAVAWQKIREAFLFQNLSVEALAYVYENTLVSDETRRKLDTHATPPEIAEYIVRQLPFEDLRQDERRVFEPFAGHAPFLIAALGKLRTLLLPTNMPTAQRHEYLVRMLSGMEIDSFAREVARYSLILADYPNSDGWNIENDDVFSSSKFEQYLATANIVLCNPPYGDFTAEQRRVNSSIRSANKAVEALRRVLQKPPKMLGFVLPRSFIDGISYRNIEHQLDSLYGDISLITLPDITFRFSESETVLLIAHKERAEQAKRRSSLVKKTDYQYFVRTGKATIQTEQDTVLSYGISHVGLWHNPQLKRVRDELAQLQNLGSIVDIHRGVEYKGNISNFVSHKSKPGFMPGIWKVRQNLEPYLIRSHIYLNIDPSVMRGNAYKRPWEKPKVIANAARRSRGAWTIESAVDETGLVCSQRFHGIWPTSTFPIEVIAAILNGPVANAFVETQRPQRDNQIRLIEQIPIPSFAPKQIQSIVTLVREYQAFRQQWLVQPDRSEYFEQLCLQIIYQIDAEILAAYDLPPRLERELLDYFAGYQRPGPVNFDRYYPSDFRPAIPWRDYISEDFRASTARRTLERLPVIHDRVVSAMVENLD
jgi:hypothetical protein